MNVANADKSIGNDERERSFRIWQDKRIEELSRDPELRADFDEDVRREALGLEPEGGRMMPDELWRRAHSQHE